MLGAVHTTSSTARKYLNLLSLNFSKILQYRSEIIVWVFLDAIPFLVLFAILSSLYTQDETIRGLTLAQTSQYYLLVMLVSSMTDTHFENFRSEQVRTGKIDFFLTRPLSFFQEILLQDIAGRFFYFILYLPVILATSVVLQVQLFPVGWQLATAVAVLISAYFINVMVSFWIVCGTFWLESAYGLEHFKMVSVTLASGALVPIAFMPDWLQTITRALPLKYLYAVPIEIMQGSYSLTSGDISYLAVIILFSGTFSWWLWRAAKRQYAGYGG